MHGPWSSSVTVVYFSELNRVASNFFFPPGLDLTTVFYFCCYFSWLNTDFVTVCLHCLNSRIVNCKMYLQGPRSGPEGGAQPWLGTSGNWGTLPLWHHSTGNILFKISRWIPYWSNLLALPNTHEFRELIWGFRPLGQLVGPAATLQTDLFFRFQEVEYLAYFCPAEYVYRVDRPKETHPVGRDWSGIHHISLCTSMFCDLNGLVSRIFIFKT